MLIFIFLFTAIFGFIGGLTTTFSLVNRKIFPNQGIWKTAESARFAGLISGLIISLIAGLLFGFSNRLIIGLITGLNFGISGGLIVALIFGGAACIQHFTLRLILYFNGCIPWNYARFLDYCTELMLLQRVGGRYRFIHKLLQDHFAQMPDH